MNYRCGFIEAVFCMLTSYMSLVSTTTTEYTLYGTYVYLFVCQHVIKHNATRPLSQCYLRSYLVKNTTEAHKEPSKKYKSNLEEQEMSNAKSNTSITRVYNSKESLKPS